jgi:hypothetical protein
MSKAKFAGKSAISSLTNDRIEKRKCSRIEHKRKIILDLGYEFSDKERISSED